MNFDKAIGRVLGHEGGFSDDPEDRGNWTSGRRNVGELKGTKFGISAASFPNLDIKSITRDKAKTIYRQHYWEAVDEVSSAVRFQVLDAAINHGTRRAVKLLQQATGAAADGIWGPKSAVAAKTMDNNDILLRFLAQRLNFMTLCTTWPIYGRGWSRRIAANLIFAADDN